MSLKTMFNSLIEKLLSLFQRVSIRTRLTLLFVLIFGSTLIVFGVLTYDFLSNSLQKEFDDALYNYAVDISESVTLNPSGDLSITSANVDQTKIYPFSLGTALIQIRHSSGKILTQLGNFGSVELPFHKDYQILSRGEDVTYRTLSKIDGLPKAESPNYRIITFPLDNSPQPELLLQVAVPLTFVDTQIKNRKFLFEFGIPLVILIAALSGYFLSSRALAPVNNMIQKAHAIGTEDKALSERLPVPKAHDEVRSLALTLNEMLSRIEQSFSSQERFIADASHQLLTPLSIMKGEMEQSLKDKVVTTETTLFFSLLQEVDHLISLVQNLLLLAQVDAGSSHLQKTNVYFEEVILDAFSRAEKLAREKNIKLKFDIKNETNKEDFHPQVFGDEDLLQNLVFNLIENAIKYSDKEKSINVLLHWTEAEQILEVEDEGPGIPTDQLENIFDRFSRVAQVSRKKGYGLGLAIAKQIARIHQAEIRAYNHLPQNGATFELRIKNI